MLIGKAKLASLGYPGETRTVAVVDFSSMPAKMGAIRSMVNLGARDPLVREMAASIIMDAGIAPRDYLGQIAALVDWMQKNVYYLGENVETFQTARYTLQHRYSDCDCQIIALAAMLESITIPTRLELLGMIGKDGRRQWRHIYVRAGLPPKHPTEWIALEPTLPVPAGTEPADIAASLWKHS